VISLTKGIAHEYRDAGVTANCLAPGAASRLHQMSRARFEQMRASGLISEQQWQSYLNTPPAEYVAPIVTWLCTDRASNVTGEVFNASGGLVGRWTSYRNDAAVHRGDHRTNPPWTLDELDSVVPKVLLASD
jgi:NAD(P)-dependent dehydrogenase (short-subunit alcohol dehydrogenase family)